MGYSFDLLYASTALSGVALVVLGMLLLRVRSPGKDTLAFAVFAILWGLQIAAANTSRMATDVETLSFWVHTWVALHIPLYVPLLYFAATYVRPTRFSGRGLPFLAVVSVPAAVGLLLFAVAPGLLVEQVRFDDGRAVTDFGPWKPLFVDLLFFWVLPAVLALGYWKYRSAPSALQMDRLLFLPAALMAYVGHVATKLTLIGLLEGTVVLLLLGVPGLLVTLFILAHSLRRRYPRESHRQLLIVLGAGTALFGVMDAVAFVQGLAFETLAAWRFLFVGLVVYGISKYRLFDIDLRLRSLAGPTGSWIVLAAVGVTFLWFAASQPFSRFPVLGVISSTGLALGLVPVSRAASKWVFPVAGPDAEMVHKRKMEVYRAALEEALARGHPGATEEAFLRDLRRSLGVSDKEHDVFMLVMRSQERFVKRHPEVAAGGTGRFIVEKEIGRGSFGRVMLARDTLLARKVVLKQPLAIWLEDDKTRERVLHEARVMARIHHPHVATVHEAIDTDPPVLVLEYVEGGSLRDLLRKMGSLSVSRTLAIACDVLTGLERVHQEGIVHRDLKPGNVLIGSDGRAKVTDFGVAHAPRQLSEVETISGKDFQPGSVGYMSPEQAIGLPVEPPSDLYAVAVMIHEMLTGVRPTPSHAHAAMGGRKGQAQGPRSGTMATPERKPVAGMLPSSSLAASGVPPYLEPVLKRALAEDPRHRYVDARGMRDALEKAAGPAGATDAVPQDAMPVSPGR